MKYGEKYNIHGYKHNGDLYKVWDETIFLDQTDEYYVFANNKIKVTEKDGRSWRTKEPAITFYYKKRWFNIIAQLKNRGIYYYCNISSPVIIENKTIKYIDYDYDLRVFPDGSYKVLDKSEFEYHKKIMNYSKDLEIIIEYELDNLINIYKNGDPPFNDETVKYYSDLYKKYSEKNKKNTSI
ncbi:MAG: DUF402 domain-containing protein [Bacilli bacterium]|nr:DUF402 domain-containing protein [Bacilli bacterium]MBP3635459.1 DUF402 domain-containing protein [Bacilli bacterium]